ncbi:metal-dependent transcriptional regulator [Cellulosimicrobium sp. NPDC057127]|uniref:metal-dependent transcriptional regulator n=1 Tax=Cellulosimicrobium sp. NPDC057127 TaxID=3346026 RepID=UPI0036250B8C
MTDLIDTTEMYLKTIYELVEEGIVPLRARIAERLGHSGPTVSQTVARMERDGLVVVAGDRHLELTPAGHDKAMRVMRKHRLAERLLTDVIRLDWEHVHNEACRWEHVMSELVEERLVGLLDHPHHDPYGNPIPGLAELGEPGGAAGFLDGVVSLPVHLAGAAPGDEVEVVLRRIGEPVQVDDELLARFAAAGLLPGRTLLVRRGERGIAVREPGSAARDGGQDEGPDEAGLDLPDDVARHLFVARR